MKKIAVLDATKISIDPLDTAAVSFPDVQLIHLLDEGMFLMAERDGIITQENIERMISLIRSAEKLDVDGIMLSCTIFSPFIEELRQHTPLPMVSADIGVFESAAARYDRIGAIVTFPPIIDSVNDIAENCRKKINPDFDVEIRLARGAMDARQAGDRKTDDSLIYETAASISGRQAIVLSQMSHMPAMPLFDSFPIPVLCSPPVSLQLICDMIASDRIRTR